VELNHEARDFNHEAAIINFEVAKEYHEVEANNQQEEEKHECSFLSTTPFFLIATHCFLFPHLDLQYLPVFLIYPLLSFIKRFHFYKSPSYILL
jgi:hypothetical protein